MKKLPDCKKNRHSISNDAQECVCGYLVARTYKLPNRDKALSRHAEVRGIIELTPENSTFTQEQIDGYYEKLVVWATPPTSETPRQQEFNRKEQ